MVIEKHIPSRAEGFALIVLSFGVMLAVWQGIASSSTTGIALCITGTMCNAALVCTSGKLLSEKMDILLLTFYTAPVSCAVLLPIFVFKEVSASDRLTIVKALLLSLQCV